MVLYFIWIGVRVKYSRKTVMQYYNRIFSSMCQPLNEINLAERGYFMYLKIKKLCEERNISIYRLEKDLALSSGIVRKWKNSIPSVDKLNKIAQYFNVPITYFIS